VSVPILWIVIYCVIAVLVLFVLTFHNEMMDEKSRCDGLAKSHPSGKKPPSNDLSHPA
jgi:hypothetical protein